MNVKTNWTKATTNPYEALAGLISCINAGKHCWIEYRDNNDKEIEFPIKKKNPALDNPFNWEMAYGIPRSEMDLLETKYFNETERDLTYNWTACYGEAGAIKAYQENATISKEMFSGGICHPVRIHDANYYREHIKKDGYKYGKTWVTHWKPKNGIPYYIREEGLKVYVICYDDQPANEAQCVNSAANFLLRLAYDMEMQKEEKND